MTKIGLYSDSHIVGGAERALLNVANAYRGAAELVVCSPNDPVLEAAAGIRGVRTHRVEASSSLLGSVLDHRRAFRELELDLVQVTLANPFASRAAVLGGILARIPTVAVEQLVLPSRRRRGRILKRIVTRFQAATIAVGGATADDLHTFFAIPRAAVSVVHNGVPDVDVVRHDNPKETPVIGCAARLEDQKGIDLLLQAMAQIPDARLVLVGDGERRDALERQATDLGIRDRVEITGWVSDAAQRIADFDVFALASRDEAFPLTIVEAMLAGTPVVATDVGSVAEAVIDGETGLLVPPRDVPALTAALRRLLDDPALRMTLAANARRRAAERYTDVAMAAGYDRVWQSVLKP